MAVEEPMFDDLKRALQEVLGEEQGTALMKRLPEGEPLEKADLVALEERLTQRSDERFTRIDERFARIDERFAHQEQVFDLKLESMENRLMGRIGTMQHELAMAMVSQTRNFIIAMVGTMISLTILLLAAR